MEERLELAVGALFAALAVLAGLAFWGRDGGSTAAAPPTAGAAVGTELAPIGATALEGVPDFGEVAPPEELAILAPLDRGSVVEGWTIEQIDAIQNGTLVVHVALRGSRMSFPIGSATGNRIAPPLLAGAYSIFMTNLHGEEANGEAAVAVAHALETTLLANAHVPVPATLGPYAPVDE